MYADGSYDRFTGKGAYCVVIVALGKKDYFVEDCDTPYVEYEGLAEAVEIAGRLRAKTNRDTAVYSDNVEAIKALSKEAERLNLRLKHIPGHLLGKEGVTIDDDVKCHHWCDTMAGIRVKNRLDTPNISSVKSIAKGTTK